MLLRFKKPEPIPGSLAQSDVVNPVVNLGWAVRLRSWLFGYDVFISYKRSEALGYALALERELETLDVACFRDLAELPAGSKFEARILKALKKSRILVIIGTPLVLDKKEGLWVRKEVSDYKVNRPHSPIVLVNVSSAITSKQWPIIDNDTWLVESQASLNPPFPSESVIRGICDSGNWLRVNQTLRLSVGFFTTIVGVLALGVAVSLSATAEQTRIAAAHEYAANADNLREGYSGAIKRSVLSAVKGVELHESAVTDRSLRASAELVSELLVDFETNCGVEYAAVSTDKRLVAFGRYLDLCVLDLDDRKLHKVDLGVKQTVSAHPSIQAVIFDPDDGSLVVLYNSIPDSETVIKRFSTTDWSSPPTTVIPGYVRSVAFDPVDGSLLAGNSVGEVWREGDPPELVRHAENPEATNAVEQIKFDPKGIRMILGLDSGLEVWQGWRDVPRRLWHRPSTGNTLQTPFALDIERNLLIATAPGQIDVLNLTDFTQVQFMYIPKVQELHVSKDGDLFAEANGRIHSWHFVKGKYQSLSQTPIVGDAPFGHSWVSIRGGLGVISNGEGGAVLYSADGRTEYARFDADGTFWHAFDFPTRRELLILSDLDVTLWRDPTRKSGRADFRPEGFFLPKVSVSPNGRLATRSLGDFFTRAVLELWDLENAELQAELSLPSAASAISVTNSAVRYVVDDALFEWSPLITNDSNVLKLATLPRKERGCSRVTDFSNDGKSIVSASTRGSLWIWCDGTDQHISDARLDRSCVSALAVSQDGRLLSIARGTSLSLYRLKKFELGEHLANIKTPYFVRSMEFSTNSSTLVLATATEPENDKSSGFAAVELRSIPTLERLTVQPLDERTIFHEVCISDDGAQFASAARGQFRVWYTDSSDTGSRLVSILPKQSDSILCQFTENRQVLIIAGTWGVRTHLLSISELADSVKKRLNANVKSNDKLGLN